MEISRTSLAIVNEVMKRNEHLIYEQVQYAGAHFKLLHSFNMISNIFCSARKTNDLNGINETVKPLQIETNSI